MASSTLHQDYPWTISDAPLVVAAPMMKITMAKLAVATSVAGGIGFLAAGFDLTSLGADLNEAADIVKHAGLPLHNDLLPIGVGFQNWGSSLDLAVEAIRKHPVSAVWFFAPKQLSDLMPWTREIRSASRNKTKIWIQSVLSLKQLKSQRHPSQTSSSYKDPTLVPRPITTCQPHHTPARSRRCTG